MNKNKIIKICCIAMFATLISGPLSAKAFFVDDFLNDLESYLEENQENYSETTGENGNQVYISNDVNVSANTGGNVISGGGEIKEGETTVKIKTETIINGKVIDLIDIESNESEASVKSVIKANGDTAQVEREIKIGSETTTENYEVDLESSEEDKSSEDANGSTALWDNGAGDGETNNLPEQSEKQEKIVEKSLTILNNWLSDFTDNFKSFFQSIFSIF